MLRNMTVNLTSILQKSVHSHEKNLRSNDFKSLLIRAA